MNKVVVTIALIVVFLMGIGSVVAHGQNLAPAYQISMKPGVATAGQPVQFNVSVQNAPSFTVAWAKEKHGQPETTFTYRVEQDNPAPTAIVIIPQQPGTWYLLVNTPGMQQIAMIVPVMPAGR